MVTAIPAELDQALSGEFAEQCGMRWDRPAWTHRMHGVGSDGVLVDLPDLLDRRDVASIVEDRLARDDVLAAFVATMVWGHGDSGYGPYRTARIIAGGVGSAVGADLPPSDAVIGRLRSAALKVRSEGAVEGYRYLNNEGHVPWLGPAFFTKWISFTSAKGEPYGQGTAPIMDALVIGWINGHTDAALRPGRTPEYERFVGLLHDWAPNGTTPVMVEAAIFELARAAKVGSRGRARRHK